MFTHFSGFLWYKNRDFDKIERRRSRRAPSRTQAHIFSVNAYNLTNELYRMHTNFIKELAPEIGRGIKLTYSLRFF